MQRLFPSKTRAFPAALPLSPSLLLPVRRREANHAQAPAFHGGRQKAIPPNQDVSGPDRSKKKAEPTAPTPP